LLVISGDEMIMSAVAKLVATGTFHKVARRSSALTSGSWGCGSSGSQKKITMSMSPRRSWHRSVGPRRADPTRSNAPSDQVPVSYTHLRAHETDSYLVCRLLLEK